MSIVPSGLQKTLRRETAMIVNLLAAWAGGTGIVMIADWRTISTEPAWQPAQFGHPHTLIVYGFLFLACSPLLVISTHTRGQWRTGVCAELVVLVLSTFLSITLVIEASRSEQGWLGAINYVFIAMVLGVLIRSTLRDHPFGGP